MEIITETIQKIWLKECEFDALYEVLEIVKNIASCVVYDKEVLGEGVTYSYEDVEKVRDFLYALYDSTLTIEEKSEVEDDKETDPDFDFLRKVNKTIKESIKNDIKRRTD